MIFGMAQLPAMRQATIGQASEDVSFLDGCAASVVRSIISRWGLNRRGIIPNAAEEASNSEFRSSAFSDIDDPIR